MSSSIRDSQFIRQMVLFELKVFLQNDGLFYLFSNDYKEKCILYKEQIYKVIIDELLKFYQNPECTKQQKCYIVLLICNMLTVHNVQIKEYYQTELGKLNEETKLQILHYQQSQEFQDQQKKLICKNISLCNFCKYLVKIDELLILLVETLYQSKVVKSEFIKELILQIQNFINKINNDALTKSEVDDKIKTLLLKKEYKMQSLVEQFFNDYNYVLENMDTYEQFITHYVALIGKYFNVELNELQFVLKKYQLTGQKDMVQNLEKQQTQYNELLKQYQLSSPQKRGDDSSNVSFDMAGDNKSISDLKTPDRKQSNFSIEIPDLTPQMPYIQRPFSFSQKVAQIKENKILIEKEQVYPTLKVIQQQHNNLVQLKKLIAKQTNYQIARPIVIMSQQPSALKIIQKVQPINSNQILIKSANIQQYPYQCQQPQTILMKSRIAQPNQIQYMQQVYTPQYPNQYIQPSNNVQYYTNQPYGQKSQVIVQSVSRVIYQNQPLYVAPTSQKQNLYQSRYIYTQQPQQYRVIQNVPQQIYYQPQKQQHMYQGSRFVIVQNAPRIVRK